MFLIGSFDCALVFHVSCQSHAKGGKVLHFEDFSNTFLSSRNAGFHSP